MKRQIQIPMTSRNRARKVNENAECGLVQPSNLPVESGTEKSSKYVQSAKRPPFTNKKKITETRREREREREREHPPTTSTMV